jgi:hypothetical protein
MEKQNSNIFACLVWQIFPFVLLLWPFSNHNLHLPCRLKLETPTWSGVQVKTEHLDSMIFGRVLHALQQDLPMNVAIFWLVSGELKILPS